MKTLGTLLQIPGMRYPKVTYYTVWQPDLDQPEFEAFRARFRHHKVTAINEDYQRIINRIDEMGSRYGCRQQFFVEEQNAHRIKQKLATDVVAYYNGRGESGLRLYCVRISSSVCVLLNGDVKTARTAQECPQVIKHFNFAIEVTSCIQQMTKEKDLALFDDENLPVQAKLVSWW